MPAANVIQLRQLLTEKFPGLRARVDGFAAPPRPVWPSGLRRLDEPLRGGLPRGALTEIVAEHRGSGSALLIERLIRQASGAHQLAALVDGADSFDVTRLEREVLSRLLWVRCRSADEALKAVDLLLRDGNLAVVLLDLVANPAKELRKIPASTWFRFQRIVEQTAGVCVALTPRRMVGAAQTRLVLRSRFSLDALERDAGDLLDEIELDVAELRHAGEQAGREALPGSA